MYSCSAFASGGSLDASGSFNNCSFIQHGGTLITLATLRILRIFRGAELCVARWCAMVFWDSLFNLVYAEWVSCPRFRHWAAGMPFGVRSNIGRNFGLVSLKVWRKTEQ